MAATMSIDMFLVPPMAVRSFVGCLDEEEATTRLIEYMKDNNMIGSCACGYFTFPDDLVTPLNFLFNSHCPESNPSYLEAYRDACAFLNSKIVLRMQMMPKCSSLDVLADMFDAYIKQALYVIEDLHGDDYDHAVLGGHIIDEKATAKAIKSFNKVMTANRIHVDYLDFTDPKVCKKFVKQPLVIAALVLQKIDKTIGGRAEMKICMLYKRLLMTILLIPFVRWMKIYIK